MPLKNYDTPSVSHALDSSPVKGERAKLFQQAKWLRRNATIHEKTLWHDLKTIPHTRFRRQVVIDHYIVDFACFQSRIIIELDGEHHARSAQLQKDQRRDCYLERQKFTVMRFWNFYSEQEQDSIIDAIYAELRSRSPLTGELSAQAD